MITPKNAKEVGDAIKIGHYYTDCKDWKWLRLVSIGGHSIRGVKLWRVYC
jgi:hypothetical protein